MACNCQTLTALALSCDPVIGGVAKAEISNDSGGTVTWVEIQTLPDTSSYNAVLTYDKQRNLKYWTTDVNLNVGALNEATREFCEKLPCPVGRQIKLTMNSGHVVTVQDAFIQTATFTPGASKTEGGDGNLVFQAITINAPTVADPTP